MKFTDGQWLLRKGVTVHHPAEVNELEVDADAMTVYAPCRRIDSRGATLDGPLITIRFSTPLQDVIRVQISHFQGQRRKGPEFTVAREHGVKVEITNGAESACLTSGTLSVRIRKGNGWAVDFFAGDKRITGSGPRGSGYIITDTDGVYLREQLDLSVGECVYGFGEHFTPYVKNGQAIEIWNEDGGTGTEQAYKNIPFYITNKGYGVFVNHPGRVSYEVASEKVAKVQRQQA